MGQPQPDQRPNHLFLPKNGGVKYLALGDSILKRLEPRDISNDCLIRAYGGITIDRMIEKTLATKQQTISHLSLSIGINDILNLGGSLDEVISRYEKLVYLCVDKFKPESVHIFALLPVSGFYKEKNSCVEEFNKLLKISTSKLSLDSVTMHFVDAFTDADTAMFENDGLHPNQTGIQFLVQLHRNILRDLSITVSSTTDIKRNAYVPRQNNHAAHSALINSLSELVKNQTYSYLPNHSGIKQF